MIKVGIDCHKLEDKRGAARAGVGRHTYNLLKYISKREDLKKSHRFYLYFKSEVPSNINFLDDEVFVAKVAKFPFFLPFFRPSFNIFFHIALPARAIIDKVNVLFFPSFMLPALCATRSVVVLTNDIYYEITKGNLPLKYRLGYRLFATWASKRATKITTQTYASRDEISENFNIKKDDITVIPLGVDILEKDISPLKKEPILFYLGQAFPRRHLRETMLAFEKISKDFPRHTLVAVGLDKYNPPIIDKLAEDINKRLGEEKIKRIESISDEDLLDYYRKAEAFVYMSSSEAMGLPPLEALLCGTSPIVADTATTRELLSGYAFFVKDPDDVSSVADVMRDALTNKEKRENIEKEGSKRLKENYTWKKHADSMVDLFNQTFNL